MAFLTGRLQPADAAPGDGLAAAIVPVNSAEYFTTLATNDYLCEAVVAAVGALLAIGTGFDNAPAYQFLLYLQVDVLWNDGFVVSFNVEGWLFSIFVTFFMVVHLLCQCIYITLNAVIIK